MCTGKECIFCCFGWSVLKILIKYIRSNVSFKVTVSLLTFCLNDLSINDDVALNSLSMTVLLSISPFMSVNICFMYFVGWIDIHESYVLLLDWPLYHWCPSMSPVTALVLKSILSDINIALMFLFLFVCFHFHGIFPSLYFQALCDFRSDMCFL